VPGIGQNGIDDLYKVARPDVDFVIVEYKFGTSRLKNTADGLQMSDSWLLGKTTRRDRIFESVSRDVALSKSVEYALRSGRVEKWLIHTNKIGGVTVWVLDKAGKFIPDQQAASKILLDLP